MRSRSVADRKFARSAIPFDQSVRSDPCLSPRERTDRKSSASRAPRRSAGGTVRDSSTNREANRSRRTEEKWVNRGDDCEHSREEQRGGKASSMRRTASECVRGSRVKCVATDARRSDLPFPLANTPESSARDRSPGSGRSSRLVRVYADNPSHRERFKG